MNISKIEGISPVIENKLKEQGITTAGTLLDMCGSAQGRKQLSNSTGLAEDLILGWLNRADLIRISGVGEEYSDLLEQAGVGTVKELRRRDPGNLHKAMLVTNNEKHLVRRVPSLNRVKCWVEEAMNLPIKITY